MSSFWNKVTQQTEYALNCGALHSIPTEYELIGDRGINFVVRSVANLVRKDRAKTEPVPGKQEKKNPFLPYEEDLFVADLSETHLCLLNKFNVVDNHLLIVTREFESQDDLLNFNDFLAIWTVLGEIDGLAFYNGGAIAGASQPHKHLQLIPLPLIAEGEKIPIAPAIAAVDFSDPIGTIPQFEFLHGLLKLDPSCRESPAQAALSSLEGYYSLLRAVNLVEQEVEGDRLLGGYNLLFTREWMLLIARSQEHFQSISVNSLGFAGSLFVRDEAQRKIVKDSTPLTVLQNVAHSGKPVFK
ncbi:MAG: phosphorylase [Oscillatoria sp. PMC 1068.18]|nr:phosphorylase [Oscillatoria sp. PMC 1076.18]MEC4989657.1 phosphorylase [Oscillatoria sp. PMC 1068.18]